MSPVTIRAAIDLHQRHALSFWDALIVRSALEGGADTLYSEDLQDGQVLDDITVVNPFRRRVATG